MRKIIFLFGVLKGHSIWNDMGDESYDTNDTEDICDYDGHEPIYKYGTKVCNQFKYCKNGEHAVGTCPEGQYFDTVVAACYYTSTLPCGVPCAASCGPNTPTYAPTTAETTERPVIVDDRCAWYPTGVSPRKHIPGTCSGFSYCIDGKFHNGACPEGQYFDKTIESCYYIDSLPCGVQCAAACPTTTESPVEISHVDSECVDHPIGTSQRFALYSDHQQLCNSFGFCRDGKYYEDDCISGQYFDPSHRGCLPIDDLPCGTVCSNPCKTIHPMCADDPTGVSARHQVTIDGEISCTSFGYCKDGDYIIEECTPGQYFDGGPNSCFPIDEIPCGTPCSNPCPPHPMCVNHPTGVSQRVASLDDNGIASCTDFGYCDDGNYWIESCTPGQYFDEEIAGCLSIDSLPCGAKCTNPCPVHPMCHHHPNGVSPRFAVVNADGYDDCTAFAYCIDGDYVTEECTPGQYFDVSIGGCLPLDDAPCSSHCSNLYGLNGYISCTQFETCIDNEWTIMTCDGTFVYDTTLGICVDPSTIPCGSPCAPDCTTEISEKDIINAIEEQVECEANYVTSQLVSTIENLIATGQTNCGSTNWESFGFTVLPDEYQDHLDQLREEARERFELLINSPLVVADLASALNQLSVEHQSIQANGEEILSELANFLEASS